MLEWLRKQFRFYFGFSKTEANGSIILILIILVATIVPYILNNYYLSKHVDEDYSELLDSLSNQINSKLEFDTTEQITKAFNPNEATFSQLRSIGLSREISNRWLKYLESGGSFQKLNDIKKIYGLSISEFERITPFLLTPTRTFASGTSKEAISGTKRQQSESKIEIAINESNPPIEKEAKESIYTLNFDLNNSDTTMLQQINGIGKVLSIRIIRFRNALGGFVSLKQLNEVYGVEDYALDNLKKSVFIQNDYMPQQININMITVDGLAVHPYITYTQARNIEAYHEQHGDFSSIFALLEIQTLDSAWFKKVSPYLSIKQ